MIKIGLLVKTRAALLGTLARLWVTRWGGGSGTVNSGRGSFCPLLSSLFRAGLTRYSVYPLTDDYSVYEIVLAFRPPCEWVGTTLAELDLRRKELLVLSIARAGKVIIFPKGPEVLFDDDRLLVFGKTATLPAEPLGGFGVEGE